MAAKLEEKRRFPRIKFLSPLRYQIRGTPKVNATVSDNLSLGGIGFIDNKFIAPKSIVVLEINILSRVLRPTGRIAWLEPLSHSDKYRLGVEFLESDLKEKNYLADYIDMQLGKL